MNSGPLSDRTFSGTPRSSIRRSSTFFKGSLQVSLGLVGDRGGVANQGLLTSESRFVVDAIGFVHGAAEHLAGQHPHMDLPERRRDTVGMAMLPAEIGRAKLAGAGVGYGPAAIRTPCLNFASSQNN